MKTINLSDRLNENLIEFDAHLDALLEQGHNFDMDDDKKKGNGARNAAIAGGVAAGAGTYAVGMRGRKVSGGNATGTDALRVGARDVSNKVAGAKGAVKTAGAKTGGFLSKAGKAVTKAAKNLSTLEQITSLCSEVDEIINFETIDDATPKKPVQKQKAPFIAGAALGLGTGAAATYAGTKHSAQIAKATKSGVSIAKAGYKTGKSKAASVMKGVAGEIHKVAGKFRK